MEIAAQDLLLYKGTKIIKAYPMTRGVYNIYQGWEIPADENPDDPGYIVCYPDANQEWSGDKLGDSQHVSWSPQDVFEMAYKPLQLYNTPKKTLHNSDASDARKNGKDIKIVGNGDTFKLLCKVSSENEGWMKSTKALEFDHGCLIQVTTQQRNPDGSYAIAEALSFVDGVKIVNDENNGRKLITK